MSGSVRNCCALAATLLPFVSLAQAPLPSLEQLGATQVVTASRFGQRLAEAPSAVTVVTAEDIRAFGHRKVSDVLASIPGVFISSEPTWDYVGARGFNRLGDYNSRFLLLVDGQRVADNLYDMAFVDNVLPVDVESIERIEFAPGAASSIYGGGAFFGVINILTKRGEAYAGPFVGGGIASHGTSRLRAGYGNLFENGLDLAVTVSGMRSRGETLYNPAYDVPGTGNGRTPPGSNAERYSRISFRAKLGGFSFDLLHGIHPRAYPGHDTFTNFDRADSRHDERITLGSLGYEFEATATTGVSTRLYRGYYYYRGDYAGSPPTTADLNRDESTGDWWGGEARLFSTALRDHKIIAGIDFQRDSKLEQRNFDVNPFASYLDDSRRASRHAIYIQDEFRFAEPWILNAGIRRDVYSSFGASVNPRLGLIYLPTPATTIKLLSGTAFRPPNASEMFYAAAAFNSVQNPNLRPERIRSRELVIEHEVTAGWRVRGSAFAYRIRDLIGQVNESGTLVFRNGEGVLGSGLELATDISFESGVRAKASWTPVRTRLAGGARPANSPQQVAKLGIVAPLFGNRVQAGLEIHHSSRRLDRTGGDVPGYSVTNLNFTFPRISRDFDLSVGVKNLFNRRMLDPANDYALPTTHPRPGRSLSLNAEYRY